MDNKPSTGSDNGLVPIRRQAIIWTNAHPIHWQLYAALRGDDLTNCGLVTPYGSLQRPWSTLVNTLRPIQNEQHFADDTFKPTFLNENIRISIKILLKFLPKVPLNNIPALVQIMVWRRPGDKPLSEPMMVNLPMHLCVTRPQWVKVTTFCLMAPHHYWTNGN